MPNYLDIIEKLRKTAKSDAEVTAWEKAQEKVFNSVSEVKKEIIKADQGKVTQGVFSFMPTEMTRITPFFPMNRGKMKDRPIKELVWENSWGRVRITGKQLSVYDETVLMAVLHLVGKFKALTFETTRGELCRIMNVTQAQSTYNSIWQSLERLTRTIIDLEVWQSGKPAAGKKKKPKIQMINSMLSGAKRDNETGKIVITVNPYFLSMYGDGFFTQIDMDTRQKLKGDVSKSLYRFVKGQKQSQYKCHILTLARAVNINIEMEIKEIRKRIRKGFQELKRNKVIKQYQILNNDIVIFSR